MLADEAEMRAQRGEVIPSRKFLGNDHDAVQSGSLLDVGIELGSDTAEVFRLELAMCLVQDPKLLLLDEPTAGMSRADTERTIELLQRIGERRITKVIIEHDMQVVFSLASRISVLAQGTVIAEGAPAAIRADPRVQLVVNLTAHRAHYGITAECLSAGKHVFSEKPLALSFTEASALLDLARRHGVRLACAPFTFMGEAQQTAAHILRSGELGTVRLIYADVNAGRVETWHPAPQSFYEVGPLFDVGGYALAIILSCLGPARRVSASLGNSLLSRLNAAS